jgi:heme-degrading monooxygenase HmoA
MFASNLTPPYYAVIFTSRLKPDVDMAGYRAAAERMVELARTMPGYLGIESARNAEGFGITASYWKDEESIRNWRAHEEHRQIQARGKAEWYEHYEGRVARVERDYGGPEGR